MAEPRTVRENANSLTSEDIAAILPHRYPFALVDRILDYEPGQWAIGRKCVTRNEEFFCGHFPSQPVMPGVLILEALAQTGAVAALSLPENKGKLALFGGIKNARFRKQVTPGDVLTLHCELVEQRGHAVGDGLRLRAVQCVGVKGSQAANLFPKLSGAAFGVAVTGDQSELALHLAERVFRALDAVAHALTGDACVLRDLRERQIFVIVQVEQLALLFCERLAVKVEQQAHFERFAFHRRASLTV